VHVPAPSLLICTVSMRSCDLCNVIIDAKFTGNYEEDFEVKYV